jgi:glycine/D-amino acid oxidase-like deaminating enzyme
MVHDAIVLGGGFYGCVIAVYLARQRRFRSVVLVEHETDLLKHASYNNQARIHGGYHYPRSFVTANRSRKNFPLFVRDWPEAVKSDFTKLYAIARRNSRVTARQFQRFCREIGAPLDPVGREVRSLFDPVLVEEVFLAQEYAFDATALSHWAHEELGAAGVEVLLNTKALQVSRPNSGLAVKVQSSGIQRDLYARLVFNCTYSGLHQIETPEHPSAPLKHEMTEIALMKMPPALQGLGVTLMDGPFFSMMPFSARNLHTLSHVRYTPHLSWNDERDRDPYEALRMYQRETRVDRMIRDAARYMPAIVDACYVESLFEIKTVLLKNEVDDGRPILFEQHERLPGYYSILGSKIDNIYDVLERLASEGFDV